MFQNYFKIAWRSLWKNRFYSLINISGLAIGLAAGIMLLLWVQNELSFDKFNKDYKHIFRLSSVFKSGGENMVWTGVPGPITTFARSVPGIESVVRTSSDFDQNLSNQDRTKIFDGNTVGYVDNGFFNLFNFSFVKGSKEAAFPNSTSVVLTQSTAKKLFGNEDAMGKTIQYFKNSYVVTGILQDFPDNSSIRYDAVFPMTCWQKTLPRTVAIAQILHGKPLMKIWETFHLLLTSSYAQMQTHQVLHKLFLPNIQKPQMAKVQHPSGYKIWPTYTW